METNKKFLPCEITVLAGSVPDQIALHSIDFHERDLNPYHQLRQDSSNNKAPG